MHNPGNPRRIEQGSSRDQHCAALTRRERSESSIATANRLRTEGSAQQTPWLRTESIHSWRADRVARVAHRHRDDTEPNNKTATKGAQRPRERTDPTGQRAPRTDERPREDDRQGESTGQGERATPSLSRTQCPLT